MNAAEGERELLKLGGNSRLVSFNDVVNTKNKVENTIKIWGLAKWIDGMKITKK